MTAVPPPPLRVPARRAALATVVLAVVWAVAFGVTELAFFPLIAAGGIITGLAGLWVRRPLLAASGPRAPGPTAPGTTAPGTTAPGPTSPGPPALGPTAPWPPAMRLDRRGALVAAAVALAHLGVSHLLFRLGSALLPQLAPTAEQVFGRTGGVPLWWAVLLGGVVTAPLEETFWRGAAQPLVTDALRRRLPRVAAAPWAVVGLSAVLYATFHAVTGHPALVAAALLGGLVWGWLLERTGSVGACMLAHGLWATGILVLPPV